MELFSALDNALSQKAQDTLTEFAAVKKADIQLQTTLGNRKGQIAANVIGAFAESQNSAFGWQVRAFGAENDTKGANAGIFFRRVDGESLYGINSFADYEDGKYGDFLRYGIGGELQNRFAAFAINYYLPITDDKGRGATVAFSQKGFDANLRISIPRLDFLKVRADYYLFDGKYGGEDDKGFRYGLEVQPISNLRIADCRLPIADCRLPIADCRFYGNGVCGQVGLVGLCHVFSSCIMPMTSATDKSHYT